MENTYLAVSLYPGSVGKYSEARTLPPWLPVPWPVTRRKPRSISFSLGPSPGFGNTNFCIR